MKNCGGQLTSFIRTLYYGSYWADQTMSRQYGLPPAILGRESPQSDKAQAIFHNPFYLVMDVVTCWQVGTFQGFPWFPWLLYTYHMKIYRYICLDNNSKNTHKKQS